MDNNLEIEMAEEASTPCPNRQLEEPPRPTHTRTRSNFSPFIGAVPRYPTVGKTLKATSIEEALEIARNCNGAGKAGRICFGRRITQRHMGVRGITKSLDSTSHL